ncbi:MAG: SAM-dependent DNA methyltransferase [Bacteroidetes bacterium]|nr:SAM-dependent DNA methyltransferase [Bacteroidota bacterium]
MNEELKTDNQVKSKKRVTEHGEVFTNQREVNAMLDLVKHETERIESRFLEPACGNGNFLSEILKRKLDIIDTRYKKSQYEWERYALLAISSIYGVDILEDNAAECRDRLYTNFSRRYLSNYGTNVKIEFLKSIKYIISRNILWGDALDYTNPVTKKPIVFSEWSFSIGDMIKRRDFIFKFLVENSHQTSMFNDEDNPAAIDEPTQDFPLIHYLKIG